jgi:peptidoglycan hydrolase CwlO-like protein
MTTTTQAREPEMGLTFERVWAMFQESDRRMQKLSEETDQKMQETALQMRETDRKMQETDQKIQEVAQQMRETDRKMRETDQQIRNPNVVLYVLKTAFFCLNLSGFNGFVLEYRL